DGAPGMRQFEELQHSVRQHDKFRSVVVGVQPPSAHRITIDLRSAAEAGSVLIAKRFAVLVLIAYGRLMLLLSPFRQRWRGAGPAQSVKTPDAGKIVRIERMLLSLVLRIRPSTIALILTSRTSLPSGRRRYRRLCAITVDDTLPSTSRLSKNGRGRSHTQQG